MAGYLKGGDRILLLSHTPRLLTDHALRDAARAWLGFDGARIQELPPEDVEIAADLILEGVIVEDAPRPSWITGNYSGRIA